MPGTWVLGSTGGRTFDGNGDEELELGSSDDDDEDTMSTTEGDDESEEDLDFGDFEMPPE